MVTWVERIFLCEYQGKYYCKMPLNGLPHVYDEIKKIETVYRLLSVGEEIKEGDEYPSFPLYERWDKVNNVGAKVGKGNIYRRKIKTYEE